MADSKGKKDESAWVTWAKDTGGFTATLIVFSVIVAVAAFFAYIGISAHLTYKNAPYRVESDCTLINIESYEKEQEVVDENYKNEPAHIRKQHMVKEKYTLYVLEWEYHMNGEARTFTTTNKYTTLHKVGDKMTQKMYSEDGVEYKRAGFDNTTDFILGACIIAVALFSFLIVRVIIERIRLAKAGKLKKNKKKKKTVRV